MAPVLSDKALENSLTYRDYVKGISILESYLLMIWDEVIELFPWHWSPSSITLAGLLINIAYLASLFVISPGASSEVPQCISLAAGILMIFGIMLDAMDGKQARRTGTACFVSDFMDHACDAISQLPIILSVFISMRLGDDPDFILAITLSALLAFYMFHWRTYVSGIVEFSFVDVIEATTLCAVLNIVIGIFGRSIWHAKMPIFGFQLYKPFGFLVFVGLLSQIARYTISIVFEQFADMRSPLPTSKTKWQPVPYIVVYYGLALFIAYNPYSNLFYDNPILFPLAFGLSFAKAISIILTCSMLEVEMQHMDHGVLSLVALAVNQLCGSFVNDVTALYMCLIFSGFDLLYYDYRIVTEVCSFLRVYCFDITRRPPGDHGFSDKQYPMWTKFDPNIHTKGYRTKYI